MNLVDEIVSPGERPREESFKITIRLRTRSEGNLKVGIDRCPTYCFRWSTASEEAFKESGN